MHRMSVLTSQKTDCLSIIKTKSLMHLEKLLLLVIHNYTTHHTHPHTHTHIHIHTHHTHPHTHTHTHTQRVEILYVDLYFEQKRNWRNYETVSESLRFAEPFNVDF